MPIDEHGCVGFLVVRLPDSPVSTIPEWRRIHGIPYCGLDRSPWWDIERAYYSNTLPEPLRSYFEDIQADCRDFSGLAVSRDYELAVELLRYSNTPVKRNEIIAVHSTMLEKAKGKTRGKDHIQWMGYDAFALGEWSLLKEGLFARPTLFPGWEHRINSHGLLSTGLTAQHLTEHYENLSFRGLVEDLSPVAIIDRVRIGRVLS